MIDPFEFPTKGVSYEDLTVELVAGVRRVGLPQLLDILEKRAILLLRQCQSLHNNPDARQLAAGRFEEVKELCEALRAQIK